MKDDDTISCSSIPIIHMDDPDTDKIVKTLHTVCSKHGFFFLQGHGLTPSFFNQALHESKELFALPVEIKRTLADKTTSRGYTAMQEETLDPANQTSGDTKEGYYIGRDVALEDPEYNPAKFAGPNQWPDTSVLPHFRSTMNDYFTKLSAVAFRICQLLALSLDLDEHYFDASFTHPLAVIRLLHYAATPSRPNDGLFACGAHSDYGMITLLLTDGTPGLQISLADGTWLDVPHVENALVVNLGDMLERWTNGLYKSTVHRVVVTELFVAASDSGETKKMKERYSIPFFYEPNYDTVVECLSTCVSQRNPARYPPTTSGQHLLDKYRQTHADFQPTT